MGLAGRITQHLSPVARIRPFISAWFAHSDHAVRANSRRTSGQAREEDAASVHGNTGTPRIGKQSGNEWPGQGGCGECALRDGPARDGADLVHHFAQLPMEHAGCAPLQHILEIVHAAHQGLPTKILHCLLIVYQCTVCSWCTSIRVPWYTMSKQSD